MLHRRFVAIRGPVAQFPSDRRTNLVGTSEDLTIDAYFSLLRRDHCQTFFPTVVLFGSSILHMLYMDGVWELLEE